MDKIIKHSTVKVEKVDKRVLRFVGSDQGTDRDGDQIMVDYWNLTEYRKNPVVLFAHQHSEVPVARTKRVFVDNEKKRLMFDIEFPEPEVSSMGDSLYKLYKNGFMQATSVGFIPDFSKVKYPEKKNDKGPSRIFEGQTLLEISLVAVGSNARALLTSKSVADAIKKDIIDQLELDELLNYIKEPTKENIIEEDNSSKNKEVQEKEMNTEEVVIEGTKEDAQGDEIKDKGDCLQEKLNEAEIKIAELELKLKEQNMEEEITEDNLYSELYDEFIQGTGHESEQTDDQTEEEIIDELIEELTGENNNG